jgi:hypothetical protein
MFPRISLCIVPTIVAMFIPMCTPKVTPTSPPWDAHIAELWRNPSADLTARDLFYGPWGVERAPDPHAVYTFVMPKRHGTNPGVIVRDPAGREWSVKQAPKDSQGAEGPVEVVLSRVLSAVGYHQPPVYFLPSFVMRDGAGTHTVPGGRFRLKLASMKNLGEWSWQQNPFVGTRPYQGLLVILLMFNSSDLKNANNTLYSVTTAGGGNERWYVVRDLGTALGETGRLYPTRGDVRLFERGPFVAGTENGRVAFNYHGWHRELIRDRISTDDMQWASDLLGRLSNDQWRDAFRAGGYDPAIADRYIRELRTRVETGQRAAF